MSQSNFAKSSLNDSTQCHAQIYFISPKTRSNRPRIHQPQKLKTGRHQQFRKIAHEITVGHKPVQQLTHVEALPRGCGAVLHRMSDPCSIGIG